MNGTEKKIIQSEVTQTNKDKHGMCSLLIDISCKIKGNSATIHRSKETWLQGGLIDGQADLPGKWKYQSIIFYKNCYGHDVPSQE